MSCNRDADPVIRGFIHDWTGPGRLVVALNDFSALRRDVLTDPPSNMADNKQTQSILFRAPFDVRRMIFSYSCPSAVHVHIKNDKVVISECVSPDAIHDQSDGSDRKADLPPPGRRWDREDDYLYAQRLMSTWGPHWRCEEAARRQQRDLKPSTLLSMLDVCKLM